MWDLIKPGIEEVRSHSADDWIVEDVYHALKSGASQLYIGYDAGEYQGFVILTPAVTYASRVLHIWLAFGMYIGSLDKFLPEVDAIARALGIDRITHSSARKGWEKVGAFEQVSANYSRKLT